MTQEELKKLVSYDPETGIFINLHRQEEVNYIRGKGYLGIQLNKTKYYLHRLAWLYMTGSIPEQIDHIDTNRANNKWSNLRKADPSLNQHNKNLQSNNTSGIKGICWDKLNYKWIARLNFKGVCFNIGRFTSIEDAQKALEHKRNSLHGEYANHG